MSLININNWYLLIGISFVKFHKPSIPLRILNFIPFDNSRVVTPDQMTLSKPKISPLEFKNQLNNPLELLLISGPIIEVLMHK